MVGSNPSCPTFPPSPPPGRPEPTPPLSAQAPIGPSPTCHPSDGMVGSNPSCPTFPPSPPRPDGTNAASQCAGANRPEPHLPPLRRNGWVQPFLPDLSPEPSPRPAGTNAASQCAGANRPEPHLPPLRRNGWVQPFLPDLPPSPPPAGRNQRLLSVRRRQSAPRSVAAQCLRGAERKLEMTRADDLRQVRTLQMRVDTRENSLGNLGALLPGLHRLKLNNSLLASVRDLGTSLARLRVLWVSRCGLEDLDGIGSFASLKVGRGGPGRRAGSGGGGGRRIPAAGGEWVTVAAGRRVPVSGGSRLSPGSGSHASIEFVRSYLLSAAWVQSTVLSAWRVQAGNRERRSLPDAGSQSERGDGQRNKLGRHRWPWAVDTGGRRRRRIPAVSGRGIPAVRVPWVPAVREPWMPAGSGRRIRAVSGRR
uniref:Uncharacterized protein n=1 Tax=Ornithorhynchus anatinus TaxID=9258 RepID=A0A6I8P6T9_ORNAN